MWSRFDYGFDGANETVIFGTRTLAEEDALYETATVAVISSDMKIETTPIVKCLNQNANIYIAIDNTFRILSENYSNLQLPMTFDSIIDHFGVSPDGHLVVLCLNDGTIHCLYTQSKGNRNIVCSTLLPNIEENVISITCVPDILNESIFIMYTNKGNCYRFNIKNLSTVYELFLEENDEFLVDFTCDLIDNNNESPMIKIQCDNRCFYFSQKYKKYFTDTVSLILALEDGKIIGHCKLTNMNFNIWNTELIQDIIFIKNLNSMYHRLLLLTSPDDNGNCFIKLLSYPDFELIYQLKVSVCTYLVGVNSEQDEIMFIEGVYRNNALQELRLKKITESIPEVKLQRLLRKKSFDEAIQFAQFYNLSLQSVYAAQAEEYVITSNFLLTKPDEFCAILAKIQDIEFIVNHCLETSASTLNGVQYLLDYANSKLYNSPDGEIFEELRQKVLNVLRRLDTFRILYCQNLLDSNELIESWSHFSCCSLLDEIHNHLINGQIDKCTLIYTRLQQEADISTQIIIDILKWIPDQISLPNCVSLICNLLTSVLDMVPDALPVLMAWLHKSILRSPLCSSKFRPGPPSDQAQVTSRLIADLIENSSCIDLIDLCITPDRLVWVLYCDIICLNHDGALTDACLAAFIAALKTEVKYDATLDTKLVTESIRTPLRIKNVPVATTYAIFDDSILLADPTSEEENLCTGILTVTVCENQLCSVHKPGGTPLSDEQIDVCVEETKKRSIIIHDVLSESLNNFKMFI